MLSNPLFIGVCALFSFFHTPPLLTVVSEDWEGRFSGVFLVDFLGWLAVVVLFDFWWFWRVLLGLFGRGYVFLVPPAAAVFLPSFFVPLSAGL